MALITKRVFTATCMDAFFVPIPGIECLVEVVYDDVDRLARSARAVCPAESAFGFWYRVSRPDRSRPREGVITPGTDSTINIPTSPAQQLELVISDSGKIGLEGDFAYPAP